MVRDVIADAAYAKDSFDPLKGKILKIQPCDSKKLGGLGIHCIKMENIIGRIANRCNLRR